MDKERKDRISKYLIGIKTGDKKCIELLYGEVSHVVRHIALKYLKNDFDADDLVQDFWADIRRIAKGFTFFQNGFGYLCKIMTRNAINRYHRLHMEKIKYVQYVEYDKFCLGTVDEESTELKILIESAMQKLSETEKLIIQLTYFEEKTSREAAKELKISKSYASKIKMEAIKKLKAELEKKFVDKRGD